jgi:predicted O-methyltransferase YrrM
VKSFLKKAVRQLSKEAISANALDDRVQRDVDLVLSAVIGPELLKSLNDPVSYVAALRQCLEPLRCEIKSVKQPSKSEPAVHLYNAFLELLKVSVPSVSTAVATHFASIADGYRGTHQIVQRKDRTSDVSRHFVVSSSSGRKGRLLNAAVTHFAPQLILELGSAYGISSLFMASALKNLAAETRKLVTIEGFEPQSTLSSTMLRREFGDLIQCEFGLANVALPRMAATLSDIELFFHDAGHTYDDYVNDVGTILPKMASGSILLLDDIYWDDARFTTGPSRAHEGWMAVVNNPRVTAAAEIDHEIGIALIN